VTLVADPTAPAVGARHHHLWHAPVGAHLAALALVLLALVPVVGTGASFSADEGAAIVQARSLSAGRGWLVAHPVPEADPDGTAYPLENAERGARGVAPFAKHPLYALALAGADRVGGVAAMVLLSVAGTVAAAGLGASLARRLDRRLARPAVWAIGVASPLAFDGYLVVAHTLAAAAAAGALLLALRALERRSLVAAAWVAPCTAVGVLLRSEFVFYAGALAVATLVVGAARRVTRPTAIGVAVAATGAAVMARVAEGAWTRAIVGPVTAGGPDGIPGGGMAGRVRGFALTWLTTGYGGLGPAGIALTVMLGAVAVAACTLRRRPQQHRLVVGASLLAALAAIVAVGVEPARVVPGLLVAFPLAAAGLVLVDRRTLCSDAARLAFGTFTVFALAVLATQYQRGGSGEWGGRYFALALPVVVPVLVAALAGRGGRVATACLVTVTMAMTVMGYGALRAAHVRNAARNAAVLGAAAGLTATGRDRPVVVATDGTLARHGWSTFDRTRWLLAGPDLAGLARRLDGAGIARFVVVSRDAAIRVRGFTVEPVARGGPPERRWYVFEVGAG
jgi:hypothetical protein